MTERGILMTPENYAKSENGSKTNTRRIMKQGTDIGGTLAWAVCPAREEGYVAWFGQPAKDVEAFTKKTYTHGFLCPFGMIGDRLYVKEVYLARANGTAFLYKHDYSSVEAAGIGAMYGGWKSSLFMPKRAARLWLQIIDVQVQRLIKIPQLDAMQEGCDGPDYKVSFKRLWESIHGPGSWDLNPWVWVLSYRKVDT